ncbi:MAG: hypothetical protein KatS3mg027_0788 [Bacteroidia bacterium]|nr:MAG: hypothetical protein KatS3mg027_0788 [Bacteroidia bacterium]
MKKDSYIHIVAFDIPYPPDYGGIIDVFYKIKYLYQKGIKVILHCFQYNSKTPSEELSNYCHKIYYYKRNATFSQHLCLLPYTVVSRKSHELLNNLKQDNYPILFETLHCAYFINHPDLKHRLKILRLSNIEHHYYYHLFLSEKNLIKKFYFLIESIKLYFYEKKAFPKANILLPVTQADDKYTHQYYSNIHSIHLPSFHPYNDISVWKGKGDYLLYHGNLSVAENYKAAEFLIEKIAPYISLPIFIAGKNPPDFLYKKAEKYPHIKIVPNPDTNEMKQLIQNAHIVWLYTHQATGLKLKLLYSLFTARFIVCNEKMIAGTSLKPNASFFIKNNHDEMITTIQSVQTLEFDDFAIEQRQSLLKEFSNEENILKLINLIANS